MPRYPHALAVGLLRLPPDATGARRRQLRVALALLAARHGYALVECFQVGRTREELDAALAEMEDLAVRLDANALVVGDAFAMGDPLAASDVGASALPGAPADARAGTSIDTWADACIEEFAARVRLVVLRLTARDVPAGAPSYAPEPACDGDDPTTPIPRTNPELR